MVTLKTLEYDEATRVLKITFSNDAVWIRRNVAKYLVDGYYALPTETDKEQYIRDTFREWNNVMGDGSNPTNR